MTSTRTPDETRVPRRDDSRVGAGKPAPGGLLPSDVIVVEASAAMWRAALTDAEAACVRNAVAARRREFQAGRAAARAALRHFGIRDWSLVPDDRRRPIWPPGIVGSIAHCRDYCVVAVSRRARYLSIGIDAEEASPLESQLWSRVCTRGEQRWLQSKGSEAGLCAKLVFCAKEAFYKAYSPVVDEFLDFADVEIALDLSTGTFTAECARAATGQVAAFRRRSGRFATSNGLAFAALTVEAEG